MKSIINQRLLICNLYNPSFTIKLPKKVKDHTFLLILDTSFFYFYVLSQMEKIKTGDLFFYWGARPGNSMGYSMGKFKQRMCILVNSCIFPICTFFDWY